MISKEQVEHIAKLARIELTDEEKEKFATELSSILEYIDKLNQVDTSKIKSISQITGLENVYKNNEIKSENRESGEEIIREAPARKGDYFKVPKILE